MNIEDYKKIMCPFCGNYMKCEGKGVHEDKDKKTTTTSCSNYLYVPKKKRKYVEYKKDIFFINN